MKNADNALWPQRQPGPLEDVLGGRVEQFYALDRPVPVSGAWGSGTAQIWAEQLSARAPDTKILLRYGKANGWLEGKPALIARPVGKGMIAYVGAWLSPALMSAVEERLLHDAGIKPIIAGLSPDVEICERSGGGKTVLIAINHGDEAQTFDLPQTMVPVLGDGPPTLHVTIAAHDVAVFETRKE
jgi:beta-galactosidase